MILKYFIYDDIFIHKCSMNVKIPLVYGMIGVVLLLVLKHGYFFGT